MQGIVFCDGPNGPAGFVGHSALPAALHAAATFDRDLVHDRAVIMGQETYAAGCHTLAGPMMNIARSPEAGRSFEGFGADPYLMGQLSAATVRGIQGQGVVAQAKHFAANSQEHGRYESSSDVDDRALREIYLPAFEESVRAGVGSVMCAYNAINGTFACENQRLIGEILKGELDFRGWVISDFMALNSSAAPFVAGTDVILGAVVTHVPNTNQTIFQPGPGYGADLLPLVEDKTVSLARVDDAATRILSTWYHFDQTNNNQPEPVPSGGFRNVQAGPATIAKIREIGAAGTVLLKNDKHALPLNKPRALAVFGLDAASDPHGVNFYSGGASANGTVAMGYGSGWTQFPYLVSPLEALQVRASKEETVVQWVTDNYDLPTIDTLASAGYNDACLVFVNSNAGEATTGIQGNIGDRNNLTAWSRGDSLIEQVAANCSNTIVVAHSPGALLMPWADHDNVTAIVWAGLPGQESGNALVDVLHGAVNPSGRLPYTLGKKRSDFSADVDYAAEGWKGQFYHINYTESHFVDYRHFQANDLEPLYPFGYGLSYTNFTYSGLKVSGASKHHRRTAKNTSHKTPYTEDLYDTAYTVSTKVKNTGKLDGHEVAQLYVRLSDEAEAPFKQLKGFERTHIKSSKSATVTFELRKRDIVYWSVEKQEWVLPKSFEVYVGANSADVKLSQKISL